MQEAKSRTVLDGICTTDHCLWVPNGSSVSPCKALSEFNLVAKGIFGPGRMCNKNSHNLCARTLYSRNMCRKLFAKIADKWATYEA